MSLASHAPFSHPYRSMRLVCTAFRLECAHQALDLQAWQMPPPPPSPQRPTILAADLALRVGERVGRGGSCRDTFWERQWPPMTLEHRIGSPYRAPGVAWSRGRTHPPHPHPSSPATLPTAASSSLRCQEPRHLSPHQTGRRTPRSSKPPAGLEGTLFSTSSHPPLRSYADGEHFSVNA